MMDEQLLPPEFVGPPTGEQAARFEAAELARRQCECAELRKLYLGRHCPEPERPQPGGPRELEAWSREEAAGRRHYALPLPESLGGLIGRVAAPKAALLPGERPQQHNAFGAPVGRVPQYFPREFSVRRRYGRESIESEAHPLDIEIDKLEADHSSLRSLKATDEADRTADQHGMTPEEVARTRGTRAAAERRTAAALPSARKARQLIDQGLTQEQVANEMGVSARMVRNYLKMISK